MNGSHDDSLLALKGQKSLSFDVRKGTWNWISSVAICKIDEYHQEKQTPCKDTKEHELFPLLQVRFHGNAFTTSSVP